MNLLSAYLFGTGIILIGLGLHFLYTHYRKITPNEELLWAGLGTNPFKKS